MKPIEGFEPVAKADAVILILGSMPSVASLREQQYYAHPKNLFWEIMGRLFDAGRELPYAERLQRLAAQRIALWDAAAQCRRQGSLDSNIKPGSIVPNDFQALFGRCPRIRAIFFNGQKAAAMFQRLVTPGLPESCRSIRLQTLPSTSPAHAAMTAEEKIRRWQQLTVPLRGQGGQSQRHEK